MRCGGRFGGGRVADNYYAVTAKLTAEGHRRTATRTMAGCLLALCIPAVALIDPAAIRWSAGRPVVALIAVVYLVLAIPWLRHRWPSRAESMALVVIGAVTLAAGCAVIADPLAGLLVAVAFAFLLGYTALCHSARLLAFAIVVAGLSIGWLALRVGAESPVTAIAVMSPIVLLNVVVVVGCRMATAIIGSEVSQSEVDRVTGLLTRASFYESVATLIGARHRDDDRYLVLVLVDVDAVGAIADVQGSRWFYRALEQAAQAVRESVRRDAVVGHVGEAEFAIADTFTDADPSPLVERLRGAIAATPAGITASIGVVTTRLKPLADRPPDEVIDSVIAAATVAVLDSRRAGGNRAHYVVTS